MEYQPISKDGKRYRYVDGGVIDGYVLDRTTVEGTPWVRWRGTPIPHALYQQILQFFLWSQTEHKSESLVRLYYSEQDNAWMAWAPPQLGIGMTVKTIDDHVNMRQMDTYPGFVFAGTGHHHCTSTAFQSGTDSADECTTNGIHFTIGNLDKHFLDIHARAVFNGNMVTCELGAWIDLPPAWDEIITTHPELEEAICYTALHARPPTNVIVPPEWQANFFTNVHGGSVVVNGSSTSSPHGASHVSGMSHGSWHDQGDQIPKINNTTNRSDITWHKNRRGYWEREWVHTKSEWEFKFVEEPYKANVLHKDLDDELTQLTSDYCLCSDDWNKVVMALKYPNVTPLGIASNIVKDADAALARYNLTVTDLEKWIKENDQWLDGMAATALANRNSWASGM